MMGKKCGAVMEYFETLEDPKPKPKRDVHLLGVGERAVCLAVVLQPLIAGRFGSGVFTWSGPWGARLLSLSKGL